LSSVCNPEKWQRMPPYQSHLHTLTDHSLCYIYMLFFELFETGFFPSLYIKYHNHTRSRVTERKNMLGQQHTCPTTKEIGDTTLRTRATHRLDCVDIRRGAARRSSGMPSSRPLYSLLLRGYHYCKNNNNLNTESEACRKNM
jgi:hypothetical protein